MMMMIIMTMTLGDKLSRLYERELTTRQRAMRTRESESVEEIIVSKKKHTHASETSHTQTHTDTHGYTKNSSFSESNCIELSRASTTNQMVFGLVCESWCVREIN